MIAHSHLWAQNIPFHRSARATYFPIETGEDPDVTGKEWAAVWGLYITGVDYVYAAAGIHTPERVGIAQFYGAAAEGMA